MNFTNATIRNYERGSRKGQETRQIRTTTTTTTTTTTLSLFVAALLFASSTTTVNHGVTTRTIPWAAEAMSPAADVTARAAAAVVRRNVISGATIFTVGDVAAQMFSASQKTKQRKTKNDKIALAITRALATTKDAIQIEDEDVTDSDCETDSDSDTDSEEEAERKTIIQTRDPITNPHTKNILVTTLSGLDRNRLLSSTVLGAVWSGFVVPFIYGNVETRFPGKANVQQILLKVAVTCSVLSTIGNYATMFLRRFVAQYMTYQFDKTSSLRLEWWSRPIESLLLFLAMVKGCFKSCNSDILEVILDDLKIWPLYDLTCYGLIPPAWRPITTSIMSSGWAMYMSVVSAKEERDEEEDITESSSYGEGVTQTPPAAVGAFDTRTIPKRTTATTNMNMNTNTNTNARGAAVANGKRTTTLRASIDTNAVAEREYSNNNKPKTIKVTSVAPPFSTKKFTTPATSKTTKRLISVTGGTASDDKYHPYNNN